MDSMLPRTVKVEGGLGVIGGELWVWRAKIGQNWCFHSKVDEEKNCCWILPDDVSSDNKHLHVLWTLGYPEQSKLKRV